MTDVDEAVSRLTAWVRDFGALNRAFADDVQALVAEVRRLRGVIDQHDLCHDLHGKVNAGDFARGCAAEQRRLYGCAPDADRAAALELKLAGVLLTLGRHTGPCDAELLCEGCLNTKDHITKEYSNDGVVSAGELHPGKRGTLPLEDRV